MDQEYRDHAATLDRYLMATFGTALSPSEREETRQQAFVGLASEQAKGTKIQSNEAMLIVCARNAAYSVLRSADRRRRTSFDPQDSAEARLADPAAAPVDVEVVEADENRRVKMLMDQLDERSRTVLQLRLELDLEMPQIADHLGVSPSHAYKLLKQAGRALSDSIAANDEGAHSRQQRALLAECEMGTATAEQRRQAEQLLGDPHARALLAELRGLGHQAAAFMPPVALVGAAPPSSGRISHMLASVKQYVTDLAGRAPAQEAASHVAAGSGYRGTGTMVIAGVLSCAGIGGAAVGVKECIDHGVPPALVDVLPGAQTDDPPPEPVPEEPAAPVTTAPVTTTPELQAEPPPAATAPEPEAEPPVDEPAPAPATPGDSLSRLGGNPTRAPAPPTGSGSAGGGGSSSATLGGL
jgi:RNA polymerase sigma factor (sigma-70 family)